MNDAEIANLTHHTVGDIFFWFFLFACWLTYHFLNSSMRFEADAKNEMYRAMNVEERVQLFRNRMLEAEARCEEYREELTKLRAQVPSSN